MRLFSPYKTVLINTAEKNLSEGNCVTAMAC